MATQIKRKSGFREYPGLAAELQNLIKQIPHKDDVVLKATNSVTTPTGGATQDAEARTAINEIITILTNAGLIE
jgi:hypothetical protein